MEMNTIKQADMKENKMYLKRKTSVLTFQATKKNDFSRGKP